MATIKQALRYFNKQVGHFSDTQKIIKIEEEVSELAEAVNIGFDTDGVIDECSDVLTIAYNIASRNGFTGTPNELFLQAYEKMKGRIERGERDYKNKDF